MADSNELEQLRAEVSRARSDVAALTARLSQLSARMDAVERPAPSPSVPPKVVAALPVEPKAPAPAQAIPPTSPTAPEPSFEDRIGGVWLNRLGVLAVFLGVGFFLKYAYDNEWIGPWGRVGIGCLAGALLLLWGEREQRHGARLFALGLVGGGLGILYASFYASFAYYHLVDQGVAFALMILVTVASAVLALRHDSLFIALFGLFGGFATPLLLSTGVDRQHELFSYVLMLDLGALWLGTHKRWRALAPCALLGTALLTTGWGVKFYRDEKLVVTLVWLAAFWAVFALLPVAHALARRAKAGQAELAWLLLGGAFFHIYAFVLVHDYWSASTQPLREWQGMVGLFFALSYLALAQLVHRRSPEDAQLSFFLHGAALLSITVALPEQLHDGWLVSAWAVEIALLLLAARRAAPLALTQFCSALWVIAFFTVLFMDGDVDFQRQAFFASNLSVAWLALGACVIPAILEPPVKDFFFAWANRLALNLPWLILAAVEAASWTGRTWPARYDGSGPYQGAAWGPSTAVSVVGAVYAVALVAVGVLRGSLIVRLLGIGLFFITAAKVFVLDMPSLGGIFRVVSFIGLGLLLLGASWLFSRSRHKAAAVPPLATLLLLCVCPPARADYDPKRWQQLREVQTATSAKGWSGFFLDQAVYGHAAVSLADLRLLDGAGQELPFVLQEVTEQHRAAAQVPTLLGQRMEKDGTLTFELDLGERAGQPPSQRFHNRVELDLRGENFIRIVEVYASDDAQSWARLAPPGGRDSSVARVWAVRSGERSDRDTAVAYAPVNQRYLRLRLLPDGGDRPEILGARLFHEDARDFRLSTELSARGPVEEGSDTLLTFDLGETNARSEELTLGIHTPQYWRQVTIEGSNDGVQWGVLGSGHVARYGDPKLPEIHSVRYPQAHCRYVRARIHNGDDRPLALDAKATVHWRPHVVAIDGAARTLTLAIGNFQAKPPSYDLAKRLGELSNDDLGALSEARLGPVRANPAYEPPQLPFSERFPWLPQAAFGLAVAAVALLLLRSSRKQPAA